MLLLLPLLFAQQVQVRPETAPGVTDFERTIRPYVRRYVGQLTYCYETQLKSQPTLGGRIQVAVVVEQGEVTSSTVAQNTTGVDLLGVCIAKKVGRWKFPAELSGETVYPFVLVPADPPTLSLPQDQVNACYAHAYGAHATQAVLQRYQGEVLVLTSPASGVAKVDACLSGLIAQAELGPEQSFVSVPLGRSE